VAIADKACVLQIFSTGKSDISSFYQIWEAVTAVFSVCIEKGKGGVFRSLGRRYLLALRRK